MKAFLTSVRKAFLVLADGRQQTTDCRQKINNDNMKAFEDLRIWQESRIFVNQIYDLTEDIKDYGFKDQIQRAAVSIMNNIAEGFDYGSDAMFIKYLDTSKASCGEVKSMLYLVEDRKYCSPQNALLLREKAKSISSGIHALIKYLKNKK